MAESRKTAMKTCCLVSSVDEKDSGVGQSGEGISHLADSGIMDKSSEEEQ